MALLGSIHDKRHSSYYQVTSVIKSRMRRRISILTNTINNNVHLPSYERKPHYGIEGKWTHTKIVQCLMVFFGGSGKDLTCPSSLCQLNHRFPDGRVTSCDQDVRSLKSLAWSSW
eukprot:CAMPEP_0197254940 /NCGR_PEP_ID=MMETSP1429-20130617/70402_1 /TAXON_ID=49237 /ORGANISM="Chaetoceros  sp., Strain UNC1202" /LENGTH=114 /DNA_ID=CAMNT_0042718079 /DNA_START=317 /DNA_END=658 /DNA_ORIENTATION=+